MPTDGCRAGRQDVLGLAVSLVATVPEKVWFCSVKGYFPWEQPKAADVRTREDGGHTIWYDEPQLLKVRLCKGLQLHPACTLEA